MFKRILKIVIFITLIFLTSKVQSDSENTITYKKIVFQKSTVHIVESPKELLSVSTTTKNSIASINSMFYNMNTNRVCGIYYNNDKLVSKNIYNRPYIIVTKDNEVYIKQEVFNNNNVKFAIGAGSYLIKNKNMYVTKDHFTNTFINGKYRRTILALKGDKILFIISSGSLWKMSKLCKKLNVDNAVVLDGGTSSQLKYNGEIIVSSKRHVPLYLTIKSP